MGESDLHAPLVTTGSEAFAGSSARASLLERERELTALRGVIGAVTNGQSRVVLVEGPAGIGKTRLLAEARRLAAEAGLRVLGARGGELEREFAFGVVHQLFEPSLDGRDRRAFEGAAAAARSVFEPGEEPAGSQDPSFASLHGLYWLTVNLAANAPLVIAVDDLHWCDSPSLRFLAYLVRRLEGLSVLVIGTLRPSERVDATPLGEITGDPLTVSIHPGVLSASAAALLVRERLGENADETFHMACHATTGGNPLLLHELLKTLEVEGVQPDAAHVATVADLGPRAASRAVLVRLARLSANAVRVAHAAAVLGDDADLATASALVGTELEEAGLAVSALVRAEVLRERPPLGFVHPLVGAVVLGDISAGERAVMHERAARVLADIGATAERVAAHLLASPPRGDAWVVETLTRAARRSLHKGAADSACAYLARALREPPAPERRATLLLELGRAEALTSGIAAVEHLSEAYELLDDSRDRAVAAQVLGRALLLTGQAAEGAALARQAATELPPECAEPRHALEAIELMAVLFGGGDTLTLERLKGHRGRPVAEGTGAKMLAAVAVQEWMLSGGRADACAELALQALAAGELIAADNGLLGVTAIVVLALADREEAVEQWDLSLTDAHRRGSLLDRKSVTLWRGFTLYWRGELDEAEESLRSSAEGKLWGAGSHGWLVHNAIRSAVLRERGALIAARHALERSTDPGDRGDPARYWLHSKLELLVAEGRLHEALAVADQFATRFADLVNPVDTPWRSAAVLALHRMGRMTEARALATQELEHARCWGAPGTVARALRALGMVEPEHELDHLRAAVELVAGSPARLEHAKALAGLGAALRRARQPTDARTPLRSALALADALGARTLAEKVRSELYAAGGRPRTTAVSGVAALTPSERRAAALAAGGQSNREIAQALFVTPKTVELHLSNAYRKLGIRSRRELPPELTG